jgi:hypothetical protein
MFQHIALLGAYVKIEQWSVSKMKPLYDIRFPTLVQIIYYRDKVCYINHNNYERKGSRLGKHFI